MGGLQEGLEVEAGVGRGCPGLGMESRDYLEEDTRAAGRAFAGNQAWSRGWGGRGNCGMVGVVATGRELGMD